MDYTKLSELDDYQDKIKLYFKKNSIDEELSNLKRIDSDKLDYYIRKAKSLLDDLNAIKINNINESKKVIIDIHKTVYEVIKLEIMLNGRSGLLNYLRLNNKGNIYYINDLIRDEIEELKKSNKLDDNIENIIFELSKEGINYTYADEKLILALIIKEKPDAINKIIETKLCDVEDELRGEIISQYALEKDINNNIDNIKLLENKKNKNKLKALAVTLLLGLNIASYKVFSSIDRNLSTEATYETIRESYDTVNNEIKKNTTYEYNKTNNEYILKKYGEVDKYGQRELIKYDLSDKELNDIEDYVNVDLENVKKSSEKIDYNISDQLTDEEYSIVEIKRYGGETLDFNVEKYNKIMLQFIKFNSVLTGFISIDVLVYLFITLNYRRKLKNEEALKNINKIKYDKNAKKQKKYNDLIDNLQLIQDSYHNQGINVEEVQKVYKKM